MQERHHYSELRRLRSPSDPAADSEIYLETTMELQAELYNCSPENEFCVFEQFAGHYFMLWRNDIETKNSNNCLSLFRAGRRKRYTVNQVFRYSKKPLQHALLMFPPTVTYHGNLEVQFQNDAMNIQKYILKTLTCTSPRDTEIRETKYLLRLIEIGLFGHLALRDEIYCQLIRQTNKCPYPRDCVFIFQLMLVCLAMFPPSKVLHEYFEAYLHKCSVKTPTSPRLLTYMAQQCLKKLKIIKNIGARTFMPRLQELQAILKQECISLPVKICDGQIIMCDEIDSWSLVSYVKNSISKKIGLLDDAHFSVIFRHNEKDIEIVVPESSSILSFLYQFCYNIDSFNEKESRFKFKNCFNVDIFYKVKLFVNPKLTLFGLDDAVAIQLYYIQTLVDYLCGKVICSKESDLVDLASLALLSTVGRCPAVIDEATKQIIRNANSIIPVQHRHEFDSLDFENSSPKNSSTRSTLELQTNEPQVLESMGARVITGLNFVGAAVNWVDSFDHDGASEASHATNDDKVSLERSSSTWKSMINLTESLVLSNLCEKIRQSWNNIELDLTSTTLAKAAFIEKVRSTYDYGARQFKVLVANSNASAQRWTQQILKHSFLNELRLSYLDRLGSHRNSSGVLTSEHKEFFYYPDRQDSRSTLNSKIKRECPFFEGMPVLSKYEACEGCLRLTIHILDDRVVLKLKFCDNIELLEKIRESGPMMVILDDSDRTIQSVDQTEIKVDTDELPHSRPSFQWIIAPSSVNMEETECILNIPYSLIVAWGYSDTCFSLEYRIYEGGKHLNFLDEFRTTDSEEGFVIKSLLEEYYGFIYKSMSPLRNQRSAI